MRAGRGISFLTLLPLLGPLAMALGVAAGTPAASARADDVKARTARLDPKYRDWLGGGGPLFGKDGRAPVLARDKYSQAAGFIRRFWEARNPYPGSSHNAFQAAWEARVEAARTRFGNITEDRARMMLLHGEAASVYKTDCGMATWPLEIWRYLAGARLPRDMVVLFYQRGGGGPYRLWRRLDGTAVLVARITPALEQNDSIVNFERWAYQNCVAGDRQVVMLAIEAAYREDESGLLEAG